MKIAIFGAGAIGGHLAAKLGAAGHEVSVVARGAHLEAVRERGIELHTGERTIRARVRASADARDLGPQDAVFVTLKATGLRAFAEAAPPLLRPDTACVFVQNGIPWWYAHGLSPARPAPPDLTKLDPGGALARTVGVERTIGAIVYSSNDLVSPGMIHNHSPMRNMLVLGDPGDRPSARVDALRAALDAVEMYSPPTADLRAVVWNKLLINFGSTICVPLGEPISAVINDPRLAALRDRAMAEGRAVALAHGVDPANVPKRPGGVQGSAATSHKPSILQDYELGRPMEVEALLGAPQAFARAVGIDTPSLDALSAIVSHMANAKGLYP